MCISYLFDRREIGCEVTVKDDFVPWETGGSGDGSVRILEEGIVDGRRGRTLGIDRDGAKGRSAILSEMMFQDGEDGIHLA